MSVKVLAFFVVFFRVCPGVDSRSELSWLELDCDDCDDPDCACRLLFPMPLAIGRTHILANGITRFLLEAAVAVTTW